MNFFNNIKETLGNVSIGLKNQNVEKQNTSEYNIHEFAGAELLLRFQNLWRLIHDDHKYCAKLASDCDVSLKKFHYKVQHNTYLIRSLQTQCQALPTVLHQVDSISTKLKDIASQIEKIEQDLTLLECLNIKVSYAEERKTKEQIFEGRVLLKNALIDNLRKEKIERRRKEVEEMERVMRMKVQERHNTFEEEHKKQMELYMQTGVVPCHDNVKPNREESSLNEIQLDLPQEDLEVFLNEGSEGTDEDNNNSDNNDNNNNNSDNNDNNNNNNNNSDNNNNKNNDNKNNRNNNNNTNDSDHTFINEEHDNDSCGNNTKNDKNTTATTNNNTTNNNNVKNNCNKDETNITNESAMNDRDNVIL